MELKVNLRGDLWRRKPNWPDNRKAHSYEEK